MGWWYSLKSTCRYKITSREDSGYWTVDSNCGSSHGCVDSTISEMGEDNASGFGHSPSIPGVTHNYDNGTYIISWDGGNRAPVVNKEDNYNDTGSLNSNMGNSNVWRNETMVRIGGDYIGNNSPVSAVPPVVKVQDNRSFTYQVSATDPDNGQPDLPLG